MDQGHQGKRAVRPVPAGRQDQHAVEFEPIGCPPRQPLLRAPGDAAQFRAGIADADEAIRRPGADVAGGVGRARQHRDRRRVVAGAERGGPPGPACHPPERRGRRVQPVQRGVQSFGEQRHRRPGGDLDELVGAHGQAGGQVRLAAGGGPVRRDGDIEYRRALTGRHRLQPGHVPAAGQAVVTVPPGGGACLEAYPPQVGHGAVTQVGHVQPAGEDTGVVVRAVPAHHRQRSAVRPLRHAGHVPPGQPADDAELTGGQVEQAQPVPAPVLAQRPLGPRHRVVPRSPAALIVIGQFVPGHDGHQPPAGEGDQRGRLPLATLTGGRSTGVADFPAGSADSSAGASHSSLTCDPGPAADEVVQATQRPSGEITGSAATAPSTISAAVRIPAASLASSTRTILAPAGSPP